jgi:hypothetical protein
MSDNGYRLGFGEQAVSDGDGTITGAERATATAVYAKAETEQKSRPHESFRLLRSVL